MPLIRRASLALLSVVASAWAVAMVVFGLSLVVQVSTGWLQFSIGLHPMIWDLLGLASIGGGQFVFMFMVADRVCPLAGRRPMIWLTELAIACLGLLCLIGIGVCDGNRICFMTASAWLRSWVFFVLGLVVSSPVSAAPEPDELVARTLTRMSVLDLRMQRQATLADYEITAAILRVGARVCPAGRVSLAAAYRGVPGRGRR